MDDVLMSLCPDDCDCSECLESKIKELEAGIDKLIIHYGVLLEVSYADSFNSKLLFEQFVKDLKEIRSQKTLESKDEK